MKPRLLADTNVILVLTEIHSNRFNLSEDELRRVYKNIYDTYEKVKKGEVKLIVPPILQKELASHARWFRSNMMFLCDVKADFVPYPMPFLITTCMNEGSPDINKFIQKQREKKLRQLESMRDNGILTKEEFERQVKETHKKFDDLLFDPDNFDKNFKKLDIKDQIKISKRMDEVRKYKKIVIPYTNSQKKSKMISETIKQYKNIDINVITALTLFYVLTDEKLGTKAIVSKKDIFDACMVASASYYHCDRFISYNRRDYTKLTQQSLAEKNELFKKYLKDAKSGYEAYKNIVTKVLDVPSLDLSNRTSTLQSIYYNLGIKEVADGIPSLQTIHATDEKHFSLNKKGVKWKPGEAAYDLATQREMTATFVENLDDDDARERLAERLSRIMHIFNLKGADLNKHLALISKALEEYLKTDMRLENPAVDILRAPKEMLRLYTEVQKKEEEKKKQKLR